MPTVELENGQSIAYDEIGEGVPVVFIHPPGMGLSLIHI